MGTKTIAQYLENNGVLAPSDYMKSKGLPTSRVSQTEKVKWTSATINLMLSRQEYLGDVVNLKTTRKSYKNHKKIMRPVEDRIVFKGVNEPIISVQTWEKAQSILVKRKRVPQKREPDIFQSYLFCSDCGEKLYLKQRNIPNRANYVCSGYTKGIPIAQLIISSKTR